MSELRIAAPYDLSLSLRVGRSFAETPEHESGESAGQGGREVLRMLVWPEGRPPEPAAEPVLVEIAQTAPDRIRYDASIPGKDGYTGGVAALESLVARVVRADLDLEPFYDLLQTQGGFGWMVQEFQGLKPLRPARVYEMAVIAVIEQQISLRAAHSIRRRLVGRFGAERAGLVAFPRPESLAGASVEELRRCGLSQRKAEYVRELSRRVVSGEVDLEGLEHLGDEEVAGAVMSMRGFGRWSAEYILVRGLGRVDSVPADDLGIRTVVGQTLGGGERVSGEKVHDLLLPFAPWRGLFASYLLAADRCGLLGYHAGEVNRARDQDEI